MCFTRNFKYLVLLCSLGLSLSSCRQKAGTAAEKEVMNLNVTLYVCRDMSIDSPSDESQRSLTATSPFQTERHTQLTFDIGESPVWVHVFADGKEIPEFKFAGLDLYTRKSELASLSGASAGNGRTVDEHNPKIFDIKLWMPGGFFEINETLGGKTVTRHGSFKCSHN